MPLPNDRITADPNDATAMAKLFKALKQRSLGWLVPIISHAIGTHKTALVVLEGSTVRLKVYVGHYIADLVF